LTKSSDVAFFGAGAEAIVSGRAALAEEVEPIAWRVW
jgi:hypothetical protein